MDPAQPTTPMLSARHLAKLLLMQSVLDNLPDTKSIHSFVVRGLSEMPGVREARIRDASGETPPRDTLCFPLQAGETRFGELLVTYSDLPAFQPYEDYIRNFCFMVAVILNERHQRRLLESHRDDLERQVQERTRQLQIEIAERTRAEQQVRELLADADRVRSSLLSLLEDQQRAEAGLRESNERLNLATASSNTGLWDWDLGTDQVYFSPIWKRQLGYDDHEIPNRLEEWRNRVHPEDLDHALEAVRAQIQKPRPDYENEFRLRHKDGSYRWILAKASVIFDASGQACRMLGSHLDITERKRAEEALRARLRERDALLKEIHHRVKNNLQVITSLLRLEAGRIDHAVTQSVLNDLQNRIRSMALLHEMLYRSDNFAQLDLTAYLTELCTHLFRALATRPGRVQLRLDLSPVHLDLDQAIPCGLIVTELMTNCFKHGFPDGRAGEVRIELQPVPGRPELRLSVLDTGVGLPADFDLTRTRSLGLQLVSGLAAQLRGQLVIGREAGATPAEAGFDPELTRGESRPGAGGTSLAVVFTPHDGADPVPRTGPDTAPRGHREVSP